MCNLYSITTNQAAIIALFRVVNRYVGNLPPMPGVFPDYPAPAIRNTDFARSGPTPNEISWGRPRANPDATAGRLQRLSELVVIRKRNVKPAALTTLAR